MVILYQILSDFTFLTATEQYAVGKNDGHNAVRLDMEQIVKQESIVGFSFGSKSKTSITRISLFVGRVPSLRIRRIGHDRIHIERIIGIHRIIFVKVRPILLKSIAVTSDDIIRFDATHNQIHPGQVVGVLLQFLSEVFDVVVIGHIFGNALTDIDKQRSRTACRVVNFDFAFALQVACNDFRHQQRYLVRGVELACFLSGICRKVTDEIFVLMEAEEYLHFEDDVYSTVKDEVEDGKIVIYTLSSVQIIRTLFTLLTIILIFVFAVMVMTIFLSTDKIAASKTKIIDEVTMSE